MRWMNREREEDLCENVSKSGTLYRDEMVFIGSESKIIHVPAQPEQLPDMMSQLFSFLKNDELDVILKVFVMYLPLSRTINENLSGYYGNLADSEWKYEQNGQIYLDITPFVFYMLEMLEKCIIMAILEENELDEAQKLLLTKMKKRGSGAEITAKNAQKILSETEEQTVKILETLVEMGYFV